MGLVHLPKH